MFVVELVRSVYITPFADGSLPTSCKPPSGEFIRDEAGLNIGYVLPIFEYTVDCERGNVLAEVWDEFWYMPLGVVDVT